jgi:hypothetical protein
MTEEAPTVDIPGQNASVTVPAEEEAPQAPHAPTASKPQPADNDAGNPSRKRKVAMFLAYNGHGYQGMQRNPGAKTIEEDLFKAIHKAGGIVDANADDKGPTKVCLIVFHACGFGIPVPS